MNNIDQHQQFGSHLKPVVNPGANGVPFQPLTPDELIPDIALRALAKGDDARQRGVLSPEDQSVLAMYLPDICGELLGLRALVRKGLI